MHYALYSRVLLYPIIFVVVVSCYVPFVQRYPGGQPITAFSSLRILVQVQRPSMGLGQCRRSLYPSSHFSYHLEFFGKVVGSVRIHLS